MLYMYRSYSVAVAMYSIIHSLLSMSDLSVEHLLCIKHYKNSLSTSDSFIVNISLRVVFSGLLMRKYRIKEAKMTYHVAE